MGDRGDGWNAYTHPHVVALPSANEVRYDVAKRFLTLVGDAEVAQAGQKINAKSITYDMQQQLISAEKDENSTDRVHTILVPVEAKIKEKTGNEGQP